MHHVIANFKAEGGAMVGSIQYARAKRKLRHRKKEMFCKKMRMRRKQKKKKKRGTIT